MEGQELNSGTQSIRHRSPHRPITKRRSTQSWMMTSFSLRDCSESEYAGPEGAWLFSISSSGKDTQRMKTPRRTRRIYTRTLSKNIRAQASRHIKMIQARDHLSELLSKRVLKLDQSSLVLVQLIIFETSLTMTIGGVTRLVSPFTPSNRTSKHVAEPSSIYYSLPRIEPLHLARQKILMVAVVYNMAQEDTNSIMSATTLKLLPKTRILTLKPLRLSQETLFVSAT